MEYLSSALRVADATALSLAHGLCAIATYAHTLVVFDFNTRGSACCEAGQNRRVRGVTEKLNQNQSHAAEYAA